VLISGDRAYVVTARDFELRAYSLTAGSMLWSHRAEMPIGSLADRPGLILVISPDIRSMDANRVEQVTRGRIVALDATTGRLRWERRGQVLEGTLNAPALVVQDDTGLVGVDPVDGSARWHNEGQAYPGYTDPPQIITTTYVYTGPPPANQSDAPDGRFQADLVDVASGRVTTLGFLSQGDFPLFVAGTPATVLVQIIEREHIGYAFLAAAKNSSDPLPITEVHITTPPDGRDPRCGSWMCLNVDNEVQALDAHTGAVAWRHAGTWIGTALAHGETTLVLIVPARSGSEVLVDAATGQVATDLGVWRIAGVVDDQIFTLFEPGSAGRAWLGVVDGHRVRSVADLGDARNCRVAGGWLLCTGDGTIPARVWKLTASGLVAA